MTVQADASQRGLDACLIQEDQPIAFASKSPTDTETAYDNIESELLAIVSACKKFNTYVLGRPFTVESDHKLLEIIHQESLISVPPRLQRMLLQLHQYNVTIRYKTGKDMLLTDAMSPATGAVCKGRHSRWDHELQWATLQLIRVLSFSYRSWYQTHHLNTQLSTE